MITYKQQIKCFQKEKIAVNERHDVYCFPAVIDDDTTTLILGTAPGELSIRLQEYYADKKNKLWKLIGKKYGIPNLSNLDYLSKITCLHKYHIGLWDILSFCTRIGSSDKTIMDEKYNDINSLHMKYKKINKIIINGKGSFKKYCANIKLDKAVKVVPLVSTSGARWDCQPLEERSKWIEEL